MPIKNKDGDWIDSRGKAVPRKYIDQKDVKRDKIVETAFKKAIKLEKQMSILKQSILESIDSYVELLEKEYEVSPNKKGNYTLTSFAGDLKIEYNVNDVFVVNDRISFAKAAIDNCLKKWAGDSNANLVAIVNDAFRVDRSGRFNVRNLIGLRRHKIKDPDWQKAIEILLDAISVTDTKAYLTIHQRQANGAWQQVNLNFSSL
jgi:hypothetical protein